jgi:hypothetical protein
MDPLSAFNPLKPFAPTNLVCVCKLSEKLNLFAVSELLTCVNVNYLIEIKNSKGSRVKIPYFGIEGAIVSVRYKGESRGIRIGGKQLRNCIATDLQCGKKNIHQKIASYKLQLCGALTVKMAEDAFNYCLENIKMVNEHWLHFNSLDDIIKENSISWLYSVLINEDILLMFDNVDIIKEFENIPDNVDYRTVRFLSMFTYDYKTPTLYKNKINTLLTIKEELCYKIFPNLNETRISNGIYNYNLGNKISLIKLCNGLYQLGFGVLYYNWSSSKLLRIMIPLNMTEEIDDIESDDIESDDVESDDVESDDINEPINEFKNKQYEELYEEINRERIILDNKFIKSDELIDKNIEITKKPKAVKNVPAHRFQIYQSGAIRQTSPTDISIAYQIKCILMQDIEMILKNSEKEEEKEEEEEEKEKEEEEEEEKEEEEEE